jgi:hypothetical protein
MTDSITALLYLDRQTFLKAMHVPYRTSQIRICSPTGYIPLMVDEEENNPITMQIGVYNIWEPESYDRSRWKYLFSHFEGKNEHIPLGSFDVGFSEPDENVNLEKLKDRLKKGGDKKSLLKRFFNRT